MSEPKPKLAGPSGGVSIQIDPRYLSSGLITLILVFGQMYVGFLHDLSQLSTAIAVALLADLVLGRVLTGKWINPASAYITGISCGILLRSLYLWPFAIASLLSVMSKYVLRYKGRHLWNPSNLGICVVLFSAPGIVAALSEQWGNDLWAMAVIWVLGSVILWRVKRFHVSFTYAASFVVLAYARTLISGNPFLSEVAPITGPMYQLMAFFMVTDPATSVSSRGGRIAVAFVSGGTGGEDRRLEAGRVSSCQVYGVSFEQVAAHTIQPFTRIVRWKPIRWPTLPSPSTYLFKLEYLPSRVLCLTLVAFHWKCWAFSLYEIDERGPSPVARPVSI